MNNPRGVPGQLRSPAQQLPRRGKREKDPPAVDWFNRGIPIELRDPNESSPAQIGHADSAQESEYMVRRRERDDLGNVLQVECPASRSRLQHELLLRAPEKLRRAGCAG